MQVEAQAEMLLDPQARVQKALMEPKVVSAEAAAEIVKAALVAVV
jgi:hypothetical protein